MGVCTGTGGTGLISHHTDTPRVQFISAQISEKGQINHRLAISLSSDKKGSFGDQLRCRHTPGGYRQRTAVSAFHLQSPTLN